MACCIEMWHKGSVADEVESTYLTAECALVLLLVSVLMTRQCLVGGEPLQADGTDKRSVGIVSASHCRVQVPVVRRNVHDERRCVHEVTVTYVTHVAGVEVE